MSGAEFTLAGNIEDEVHQRLADNMLHMANEVVRMAEQFAPKKTGALATSIGFDWNYDTLSVVFTVGVPYGIFQEYGTRNMSAHPYLRPAINAVAPIYGFNVEMAFLNTPDYNQPVLAVGSKFAVPQSLSSRQKEQVRANEAYSKKYYHGKGNVRHTKMHAHRRYF